MYPTELYGEMLAGLSLGTTIFSSRPSILAVSGLIQVKFQQIRSLSCLIITTVHYLTGFR